MPAEWEPHDATWIAWPHNRSDWPGKFEAIPWVYAEIVRHLSRSERVNILVNDEAAEAKAREVLVRANVLPQEAVEPGKPSGKVAFVAYPDESRLDARLRADLRQAQGQTQVEQDDKLPPSRLPRGASTPGPSTAIGSWTLRCQPNWRSA